MACVIAGFGERTRRALVLCFAIRVGESSRRPYARSVVGEEPGVEEPRAAAAAGTLGGRCLAQVFQIGAAVRAAGVGERAAGGAHDGERDIVGVALAAHHSDEAVRIAELRRPGVAGLVERVGNSGHHGRRLHCCAASPSSRVKASMPSACRVVSRSTARCLSRRAISGSTWWIRIGVVSGAVPPPYLYCMECRSMTLSTRRVTLGVNCAGAEGVLEVRQAPDNASASMRRRAYPFGRAVDSSDRGVASAGGIEESPTVAAVQDGHFAEPPRHDRTDTGAPAGGRILRP